MEIILHGRMIGLVMLLHLVHCSSAYQVQYSSGTIIQHIGTANVGHVKFNMLIKIPKIWTIPEPEYVRPCVMVHQFLTHLTYSNVSNSDRLLIHFQNVCADYARIKRLNEGVRGYYRERIATAEDTIKVLFRQKRSLGSFLRHSLGIADRDVQLQLKRKITNLQDEDFHIKGLIEDLDFRVLFNSERLVRLERAASNAASMIENFARYFDHVTNQFNGREILQQYKHVMLQDALNSGLITNQFLELVTKEMEVRVDALAILAKHYLPIELVPAQDLEIMLENLQTELSSAHPSLVMVHKSIYDYYSMKNIHSVVQNETIYISVPLLLNFVGQDFYIYDLQSFYLPIPTEDEEAAMLVQHRKYVAINHQAETYFLPTAQDIKKCVGSHKRLVCNDHRPTIRYMSGSNNCEVAIISNNTENIRDHCDIGVKTMDNIQPEIIYTDTSRIIMINPNRQKIFQYCEDNRGGTFISQQFLVETSVKCFCWVGSSEIITPTFVYKGCINTQSKEIYHPIMNILYLSVFLNDTTYRDVKQSDLFLMSKLKLPREIADYSLTDHSEYLDLKKIVEGQKLGFRSTTNERLNIHDKAIKHIGVFKILAMFVPIVIILVIIITICLVMRTKKIGQLVSLLTMAPPTNAALIDSTTCNHIDFISECIILLVSLNILIYWCVKNYTLLCKFINVLSLPFQECISTRNSPKLHLILYISNLKDYSYLYIDTLQFCLPHNVSIMADTDGLEINMHSSFCTSYITMSNKLRVSLKEKEQVYAFPRAVNVPILQNYTVKAILASDYRVQILVGSNNIYRAHDIEVSTEEE